jgi:hypothetical protein
MKLPSVRALWSEATRALSVAVATTANIAAMMNFFTSASVTLFVLTQCSAILTRMHVTQGTGDHLPHRPFCLADSASFSLHKTVETGAKLLKLFHSLKGGNALSVA